VIIEIPIAHTAEVAPVRFFGLEVEVLEDVGDVVPDLHQESIGMIHKDDFNGREEVVVSLFLTVKRRLVVLGQVGRVVLTRTGP
jgi:hypothetical protein